MVIPTTAISSIAGSCFTSCRFSTVYSFWELIFFLFDFLRDIISLRIAARISPCLFVTNENNSDDALDHDRSAARSLEQSLRSNLLDRPSVSAYDAEVPEQIRDDAAVTANQQPGVRNDHAERESAGKSG